MMNLHGEIINYAEIEAKFPNRVNLLDSAEIAKDKAALNSAQDILFLPNDVMEENILVDGHYRYHIVMAGIMPSGLKTVVILRDTPYFYLRVPDEYLGLDILDADAQISWDKVYIFGGRLKQLFIENNITVTDDWIYERKYQNEQIQLVKGVYIKIHFHTLGHRRKAIQLISLEANKGSLKKTTPVMGYYCHTAMDDLTCYYRVSCREYKYDLCAWNTITTYKIQSEYSINRTTKSTFNGDVILYANVADIKNANITDKYLLQDKSINCYWDIECNRAANDGEMPNAREPEDKVFMISMVFAYPWSNDVLMRVCITSEPTNAREDDLTIQCNSQVELLRAFAIIFGKIQPEFISGFNDGDFDWIFIAEKATHANLMEYFKSKMSLIYTPSQINDYDLKKMRAARMDESQRGKLMYICQRMLGTMHRDDIPRDDRRRGQEFEHQLIKLDSQTQMDVFALKFFGYIPIDMRAILRIEMSNPEQSSLNYFLTINKLQQKTDMPIQRLFEIYADMQVAVAAGDKTAIDKLRADMTLVKEYCVYDSEACHLLANKKNIIMDKRSISSMSMTSMRDAIIRANGMKVRNMVMSYASSRDILYSNISQYEISKDKYPGAFVVPPKKGMQICKLTIRERVEAAKIGIKFPYHNRDKDYSQWAIDEPTIARMESLIDADDDTITRELSTEHANMLRDFIKEDIGRPISGLDFKSLYPSLIMTYNLNPETMIRPDYDKVTGIAEFEAKAARLRAMGYLLQYIEFPYGEIGRERTIRAYSMRHTFDPSTHKGEEAIRENRFGVFATLLFNLMAERDHLKRLIKENETIINTTTNREEHEDAEFRIMYNNTKQLAVKVFMNTFYGEAGNKISPLFMLELAGGVTTMGQYNIKKVINYVYEIGASIVYGDTDSTYIRCSDNLYRDIDLQYYSNRMNKLDYCTTMVDRTFGEIARINKLVNDLLLSDNGTRFLKMAYEEVLYPVAFLAKKKYYGIKHEDSINFLTDAIGDNSTISKIFIRGVELRKRGIPEILKTVCSRIMLDSLNIYELRPLMHLVEDAITSVYSSKWEVTDFTRTDVYRPRKKNIRVHTFVRRMLEERNIIIKPVERFKYVYVNKYPYKWDTRGKTIILGAGDMMELEHIAEAENMTINLDRYVTGSLIGQFARLIIYHHDFGQIIDANIKRDADDTTVENAATNADDSDNEEDIDAEDKENYTNARAYVKLLCKKYIQKIKNPSKIHQRVYKVAEKAFKEKTTHLKGATLLEFINDDLNRICEKFSNDCYKESVDYVEYKINKMLKVYTIQQLHDTYNLVQRNITTIYGNNIDEIRKQLDQVIRDNDKLKNIKEQSIEMIVNSFRSSANNEDMEELSKYYDEHGATLIDNATDNAIIEIDQFKDNLVIIDDLISRLRAGIKLYKQYELLGSMIADKRNRHAKLQSLPQLFNAADSKEDFLSEYSATYKI